MDRQDAINGDGCVWTLYNRSKSIMRKYIEGNENKTCRYISISDYLMVHCLREEFGQRQVSCVEKMRKNMLLVIGSINSIVTKNSSARNNEHVEE